MKKQKFKQTLLLMSASILLFSSCSTKPGYPDVEAPVAPKKVKELTMHGDTRIDNYFWMNERDSEDVLSYLNAENAYTDTMMAHTANFQQKLYDEMIARIKKTDESVPVRNRGYYYYSRTEGDAEYPLYCRKKGSLDAEEEIMLNVPEMAEGHEFYSVGGSSVSTDNNLLAFGVDTVSRRQYTIYFKDLTTGTLLKDEIPNSTGGVTWANDNKTVFYTVKDEQTLLPYRVYKHTLGTPVSEDELVYEEKDNTFYTFCYKTKSEKFIVIGVSSTLSSEYRILDANNPNGEFKVFEPRHADWEYRIAHFNDKFYIVTNHEAKNFRVMETPDNKTSMDNWKEFIPHREDVLVENIEIFKNFFVVEERIDGLTNLRIINNNDGSEYYLDFGEETYTAYTSANPEFDTDIIRYGYTSLTTPSSTYDFNMNTKEKTLLKQQEVLGDFNPDDYEAKRLYATARDGIKVPISLVYKKGMKLDGNNPLLLYGYGSYGASMDAYFSSVRLSLLDRGFVYAIAHIRGGQEMGRDWYENGKMFNKKNTFYDFIDCGEYLIEQQYTKPEKLFAMGGSAGGLLMGAVVNMRPDLWKGVIAAVPFVDVVTTMLDESIPLTTGEYDEWGNPNNKDSYEYMLSYSPYDNVEVKAYPAMLVTTGYHDSQVQYWEPAKWVAKLRELKTDDNLLLFKINMDYGHGGASGRFQRYREIALEYAFMFDQLGIYE